MTPATVEHRSGVRTELHGRTTEVELAGRRLSVQVMDLSEGGMRILLPRNGTVSPDDELSVALGNILPPVRARVRWVAPDRRYGDHLQLGLSFESLVMESRPHEEVVRLFEAWEKLSLQYSVFDSYVEMVESLDSRVLDDRVDDMATLAHAMVWWMEQQIGPLNLWGVVGEPGGELTASLLVDRGHLSDTGLAERRERVLEVARARTSRWYGGSVYISGPSIVLEFAGESDGRQDVLQRMANFLGARMALWNKILIKNQALRLFGDQADARRGA